MDASTWVSNDEDICFTCQGSVYLNDVFTCLLVVFSLDNIVEYFDFDITSRVIT